MKVVTNCAMCAEPFESSRRDARYCSPACRKAKWRGVKPVDQPVAMPGAVYRATRAWLAWIGAEGDVPNAVLRMAEAIDAPSTSPSAVATLAGEMLRTTRELQERFEQRRAEENERNG